MSKTKSSGANAAKVSKKDSKKAVTSVKEGRVTKPAQTPKAKSKEIAKSAAKEVKKSKKAKKEPTPEPESESESESSAS
jgi:nucleolin